MPEDDYEGLNLNELNVVVVLATNKAEELRRKLTAGEVSADDMHQRSLLSSVDETVTHVDDLRNALGALESRVRAELGRWRVRSRFTPERLSEAMKKLKESASRSPGIARRRWLGEIADALAEGWLEAAELLLRQPIGVDSAHFLRLSQVADDVAQWRSQDNGAGLRAVRSVRDMHADDLASRKSARAARELLLCEVRLLLEAGEVQVAADELSEWVRRSPHDNVLQAESASAMLRSGDDRGAYTAAMQAVETAPDRPDGYLHLGAVEESRGSLEDAGDHYHQGCQLLDVASLEYLGRGSTLLWPTGMLHRARARRLEELEFPQLALEALNEALAVGVNDTAKYPDAEIHQAIMRLMESLNRPADEVASEALTAGKQMLWNGDSARAVPLLRKAVELGQEPEAGWFLADAMLGNSWPDGAAEPDQAASEEAEQMWRSWLVKTGPPDRSLAWAYASGAILAERRSMWGDRATALWEAVLRIEKALLLDNSSALFWGLSARYLRGLRLDGLAAESGDRGFQLDPEQVDVQHQRLVKLFEVGRLDLARKYLDNLSDADSDPWLLGIRAWLDNHEGQHEEALLVISRALEANTDDAWLLEIKSSIMVALGRLEDATEDLLAMLDSDTDQSADGLLRRARALILVDRGVEAAELISKAAGDPLVGSAEVELTRALMAAASGDFSAAQTSAATAFSEPITTSDWIDLVSTWRNALALLEYRQTLSPVQRAELLRFGGEGTGSQVHESSADENLDQVSQRRDIEGTVAALAVRAIAGRRHLARAYWDDAVACYSSLEDTEFEPECRIGVAEALRGVLEAAVNDGDEFKASATHQRLAETGQSPYQATALVVADAAVADGDLPKALATLQNALEVEADVRVRLTIFERLGDVAAAGGQQDIAETSLQNAADQADQLGNPIASAQMHAQLAILVLQGGRRDASAVEHLRLALDRLLGAGALDPTFTLALELRGLARKLGVPEVAHALASAYDEATRSIGHDASTYARTIASALLKTRAPAEIEH